VTLRRPITARDVVVNSTWPIRRRALSQCRRRDLTSRTAALPHCASVPTDS